LRTTIKAIFFLAICPVLNLTNAVASTEVWFGFNTNFPSGISDQSVADALCVLWPHPRILSVSLELGSIVLGKDVPLSGSRLAARPSGQIKFTSITEQFFEPGLLTNNSKSIASPLAETIQVQFWAFNIWGLAQKISFNSAPPFTVPIIIDIAPITANTLVKKTSQDFHLLVVGVSI
jgi:hypothetical protein